MTRAVLVLAVALLAGCAIQYRSGSSCYSFEMISTEDWCEKQRVIDKANRVTAEELWADQLRKNEGKP